MRDVPTTGAWPFQRLDVVLAGSAIKQVARDFLGQRHPGLFAGAAGPRSTGQNLKQLAAHGWRA